MKKGKPTQLFSYKTNLEADIIYYWCNCGLSSNQPFCDGSHKKDNDFQPIEFSVSETKTYALCGCRHSYNLPFCDGHHKSLPKDLIKSENSILHQTINTDKAPIPVGNYPHAKRVGNLLFLSGIGPRTPSSDEIPGLKLDKNGNFLEFDFAAQVRSVFDNVKIVLEASGSSWQQLVDVTVFLVDMKRDFDTYNKIWAEYFPHNPPCRTTCAITALPTPIAIELKCIATIE